MYERDGTLNALPSRVAHKVIPPGMLGYAYLNNLEATVLATTTPQLDVMTFRRSRKVKHYSMVQHALGEARYVRPFAYDYYDSVLCCGPILKSNIRALEVIRKTPKKLLLETGLPHYEFFSRFANKPDVLESGPTVLIAPSWGPLSMFEALGTSFVNEIAKSFNVIVRPHPQMRVSQKELYDQIKQLEGVEIDTALTPMSAMSRAHVLISDISGISHEFAFIFEKPVLVVDRKQASGGLEGELLGGDSELKERCKDFIVPIQPCDLDDVATFIHAQLRKGCKERITATRGKLIYNYGSAAEVAARQLLDIVEAESEPTYTSAGEPLRLLGSLFRSGHRQHP
jgi:hypothetical protein